MNYPGLTTQEASQKIKENGYNELPEPKNLFLKKLLKQFISLINLMLLLASILSLATNKTFDFVFILILMFLNIIITLWQENKADKAIKKLNQEIASFVEVLRDEKFQKINSREIVPDDIVKLSVGDIVPADSNILELKNLSVNESGLTGESLPVYKNIGQNLLSGSFIVTGQAIAKVIYTGGNTYMGRTVKNLKNMKKKSLLEQDILNIAKYLTIISLASVLILNIFFLVNGQNLLTLLTLDLSIVIAGIPISLNTVMTLIIELGALELFKKKVVVRKISALEELSNVNLVLTDKTGTLTRNKIEVISLKTYDDYNVDDMLLYAYIAAEQDENNPICQAIIREFSRRKITEKPFEVINFTPADSNRKRSSITIKIDEITTHISQGAPQVIQSISDEKTYKVDEFEKDVKDAAEKGFRTLAVAVGTEVKEDHNLKLIGIILFSDTLRDDAKEVIKFLGENQIKTIMVTGDNHLIGQEISRQLGLTGKTLMRSDIEHLNKEELLNTSDFSEVLPDDKFKIVEASKKYFIVAANGDGVNDVPAIKSANVGIAVSSAVDSLKSAADIVLLTDGINVIKDAIIESRKIFERVSSYALYRISESLRLILAILIIALMGSAFPLTPLQIILLALLNDIPIISLAFDNVKIINRPSEIKVKQRFVQSSIWGLVGLFNSILFFVLLKYVFNIDWAIIQTMFFLKLTVSGHLLIYVTHTKERWFKFLPNKIVIFATLGTQLLASFLALTGFLMPTSISIQMILIVWAWAFFWMQISEVLKVFRNS